MIGRGFGPGGSGSVLKDAREDLHIQMTVTTAVKSRKDSKDGLAASMGGCQTSSGSAPILKWIYATQPE